jgi:integrase
MHECTRWTLGEFRRRFPDAKSLAICKANGTPQNAAAVKVWFGLVYRRMGLEGCSSHTGRRSLITFLANNHGRLGMSLVDVQRIAGHEDLTSTEKYIQPSANLHRLIEMVPWLPPRGAIPQAASQAFVPPIFEEQPRPPVRVDDPLRSFASGAWGAWRSA